MHSLTHMEGGHEFQVTCCCPRSRRGRFSRQGRAINRPPAEPNRTSKAYGMGTARFHAMLLRTITYSSQRPGVCCLGTHGDGKAAPNSDGRALALILASRHLNMGTFQSMSGMIMNLTLLPLGHCT